MRGKGKGNEQEIAEETEREDRQGEGIAGALGVAIEEAGEGFIVVFWDFSLFKCPPCGARSEGGSDQWKGRYLGVRQYWEAIVLLFLDAGRELFRRGLTSRMWG